MSYNKRKKLAILNPSDRLAANTEYTVGIEGAGDCDALAVKHRGGTEMATDKIWHSTTGSS